MKNVITSFVFFLVSCVAAMTAAAEEDDMFSLFAAEIQRAKRAAGEESPVSKMPDGIGRVEDAKPATTDESKSVERVGEKQVVGENPVESEKEPSVAEEKSAAVEKPSVVDELVNEPVEIPVTVEKSTSETAEIQALIDQLATEAASKTNVVEKIVEVKVPVTNTVERVVEKPVIVEKPVEVEKRVEVKVPVTNTVEKVVEKRVIVEKPVEVEKRVEIKVPVTNTVEKIVEKTVVVERTNVVEKIILDKSREKELLERERQLLERQNELQTDKEKLTADNLKLSGEKDELTKQVKAVEEKNQEMTASRAALGEQLSKERDHRQRLERVVPKEKRQFADNFLKITAPATFYDRKEGYAVFQGGVYVHDNEYELHSRRAFVFNDPVSNTVARIVALENVAVTNGSQRAYGVKASYYRATGMVILYGDETTPAIVRDESKVDDQEVVGSKIKFWLNSQQVEVLKARIKTPLGGSTSLKRLTSGQL